jgi:hypothetical protein
VLRNLVRRSLGRRALLGLGAAAAVALAACVPVGPPPPPPGVYQGLGFDTCAAPSTSTMSAWMASPYRSVGVYIGGESAACLGGNLTSAWVSTVTNEGWKLAPLYVGLQAPCGGGFSHVVSTDPNTAFFEGLGDASTAQTEASGLGLGAGSPIYLDMESYNCGGYGSAGTQAVLWYVNGWVTQLHQLGYVAGFYSSSGTGITDQVTNVENGSFFHPPDDIWFANWNNSATTASDPFIPDGFWGNDQRLHQYAGGHVEGWGGVVLDIDSDADNGQLAG